MFGNFFGNLSGQTAARNARQLGQRNEGRYNAGYDQANEYATEGRANALARWQPFADSGRRAYTMYADSTGANGDDARRIAFGSYQSDPFNAHSNEVTGNHLANMFRKYHAQGLGNSGNSQLALSRAGLEAQDRRISDWRNMLAGLGQTGMQAAGAQAGIDTQYYGGMADRALGRTRDLVGNDTQSTMAASNALTAGANNILGGIGSMVGMGIGAFTPNARGVSPAGNFTNWLGSFRTPAGGYAPDPNRPWA